MSQHTKLHDIWEKKKKKSAYCVSPTKIVLNQIYQPRARCSVHAQQLPVPGFGPTSQVTVEDTVIASVVHLVKNSRL